MLLKEVEKIWVGILVEGRETGVSWGGEGAL
jgi:hypothetical protein